MRCLWLVFHGNTNATIVSEWMIHFWAFYSGSSLWLLIFQLQLNEAKTEILTFPLEVTFSKSCKAVLCFLSLKPITCISLPVLSLPLQYLDKPWLLLLLSFRPGFPVHPCTKDSHHNTSAPLQFPQCWVEKLFLASLHWPVLQLHWKLSPHFSFLFTTILKVISFKEEILFQCTCMWQTHTAVEAWQSLLALAALKSILFHHCHTHKINTAGHHSKTRNISH